MCTAFVLCRRRDHGVDGDLLPVAKFALVQHCS